MRRTLASPKRAISSNRPSTMRDEVLSASISTAKRSGRVSSAMVPPWGHRIVWERGRPAMGADLQVRIMSMRLWKTMI